MIKKTNDKPFVNIIGKLKEGEKYWDKKTGEMISKVASNGKSYFQISLEIDFDSMNPADLEKMEKKNNKFAAIFFWENFLQKKENIDNFKKLKPGKKVKVSGFLFEKEKNLLTVLKLQILDNERQKYNDYEDEEDDLFI